ncbi:uncharacterized protein C8orf88 homolog isoform X1 [Scyliorhinus canicula]|uniref:uncharacterized protein C8orf88 homolog isoform X1 n=1 Tax=Scyliorhinus canicula TaxID=7830 RepID=UPI0018F581FE|nr:uncharacterized protein C8orf88 homolog isoform X1 [Scyliorhinus canicula]
MMDAYRENKVISPIIMDASRKVPVIRKSLKPARPLHRLSAELDSAVCIDYLPPVLHQNEVTWSEENWSISSGYTQRETKWSDAPTFRSKQDLKGQERPIERRHSGQGDGTKKDFQVELWRQETWQLYRGEDLVDSGDAERITYTREFLMKIASLPISKEKPEFLPSLPVVLERPVSYAFLRERLYGSGRGLCFAYQKMATNHHGIAG